MIHLAKPIVLIVDDDEAICKTVSAILQSDGYETAIAMTAKEAIEKARNQFFDLALLDIRLPDMEGTQLLARLQEIVPETLKIMITGYPALKNAVEALNFGAASYIMKPVNPAELLKTIRSKLELKQQTEKATREKLAKWIQYQARKARSPGFQEFLEAVSTELADFGLTKTQAKIYVTLLASGIASVSEIASLSKVRREEVYRTIPGMEKYGIVTRKLNSPRKFSVVKPEQAMQLLTRNKLKVMKEEIDRLEYRQTDLTARIKAIELPIEQNNCSIDVISASEHVVIKLVEMTEVAKQKIDLVVTLGELKIAYANRSKRLRERLLRTVKMRVLVEKCELDVLTREILQSSKLCNNPIELRTMEKIPFNLMIVDDKEAMWGDLLVNGGNVHSFWTGDPMQIAILKTSFENLWENAQK